MLLGTVGHPSTRRYGLGSSVGFGYWVCWERAATPNIAMTTALPISVNPTRPARGIVALPAENEVCIPIGIPDFNPCADGTPLALSRQAHMAVVSNVKRDCAADRRGELRRQSNHSPHPEERATEIGFTRFRHLKKDRNRQQPISIARVTKDGTSPCTYPSFETAAQKSAASSDTMGWWEVRSLGLVCNDS